MKEKKERGKKYIYIYQKAQKNNSITIEISRGLSSVGASRCKIAQSAQSATKRKLILATSRNMALDSIRSGSRSVVVADDQPNLISNSLLMLKKRFSITFRLEIFNRYIRSENRSSFIFFFLFLKSR